VWTGAPFSPYTVFNRYRSYSLVRLCRICYVGRRSQSVYLLVLTRCLRGLNMQVLNQNAIADDQPKSSSNTVPFVYLNFRVYHNNPNLLNSASSTSTAERQFYEHTERQCCSDADAVIALCAYDTKLLQHMMETSASPSGRRPIYATVNPPLRADVLDLAMVMLTS